MYVEASFVRIARRSYGRGSRVFVTAPRAPNKIGGLPIIPMASLLTDDLSRIV